MENDNVHGSTYLDDQLPGWHHHQSEEPVRPLHLGFPLLELVDDGEGVGQGLAAARL